MRRTIAVLLAIPLIGCATVGKPLDHAKINEIKEGVTTKEEVVILLGKPYMISLGSDGKETMVYQYIKTKMRASSLIPVVGSLVGGADTKQEILQVLIGEDNKVEKYIFNVSDLPTEFGLLNTNK